jgi:hypothetical protein
MNCYFNTSQISLASEAFTRAEALATQYFRLPAEAVRSKHYDVKTLAKLKDHEVREGAFAHICKYHYEKAGITEAFEDFHFYRICLQDGRILDAVDRGHSFIKLDPLLLYIAAHELVHVIRFEFEKIDFDAPEALKAEEEEKVHNITRNMLLPVACPDLKLVLECFSSRYQIGDWIH